MNVADRVKETTTVTSTATISLGGAIAGFRRFIAGFPVGAKNIPVGVDDLNGKWENSKYTLTDANTLTRTSITSSSNDGAAVAFSAGVKEVSCIFTDGAFKTLAAATSERVYYVSQIVGDIVQADLSDSSTTFGPDSTAAIQAVLDTASASSPLKVVFDSRVSSTGWRVKGNTTIEALPGCGAILRTNSNKTLFENYNITFNPAARVDRNITVKGGTWNGNRGASVNNKNNGANNSKGNGTTGLNCIFRFYGVENLTFDPDVLLCSPSYSSHVMNCKRIFSSRVLHSVGNGDVVNTDGHNTGGNCEDIVYRDLTISGYDDPLSISPDDVWGIPSSFVYPFYPVSANGPIKNVLVDGVKIPSRIYGIRLMSGQNRLENVVIRNVSGATTFWGLLLDNYQNNGGLTGAAGNGNIGPVEIDGFDMACNGVSHIYIRSSVEKLAIRRLKRNDFGDATPTILISGAGIIIDSLEIDGYDSADGGSARTIPHIRIESGTIRSLKINNARVRRAGGANGSVLVEMVGGSIDTLTVNNVEIDGIDNLVKHSGGTIGRIVSAGVAHLNAPNGEATFKTAGSIQTINVSAYVGELPTAGTFTKKSGDGFVAVIDTTAPTVTAATVSSGAPTVVRLAASETLNASFVPAASAFAVSGRTVLSVAVSGQNVDLTVDSAFVNGESRTVAYTAPGSNGLRDPSGNLMASFAARAINNTIPPAGAYAPGSSVVTLAGDSSLSDVDGVKRLTGAASSASSYYRYGGAAGAQKIPAGQDGWVGMRFEGAAQYDSQIGFNTSETVAGGDKPHFGLTFSSSKVVPIANGSGAPSSTAAPTANALYRINVVGSTVTMEGSSNNGVAWAVLFTFATARTGDLYVNAGLYNQQTIPYMQGAGLS